MLREESRCGRGKTDARIAHALSVSLMVVACGGGAEAYSRAQTGAVASQQSIPLVVDTVQTEFSGSAFPDEKIQRARVAYRVATAHLFQEAFKARGLKLIVAPVQTEPASGAYLVAKIIEVDSSSSAGATAGTVLSGSVFGNVGGTGEASATVNVRLLSAGSKAPSIDETFSFEGMPDFAQVIERSKDATDKQLLGNHGTACLYNAIEQFAAKLAGSLGSPQ